MCEPDCFMYGSPEMNNRPLNASAFKNPICTLLYDLDMYSASTSASIQKMHMHQTHLAPRAITAANVFTHYNGNT